MRYVHLAESPTLEQLDTALAELRTKRRAALPIARGWIDAEIDEVLDLRNMLDLETRALS